MSHNKPPTTLFGRKGLIQKKIVVDRRQVLSLPSTQKGNSTPLLPKSPDRRGILYPESTEQTLSKMSAPIMPGTVKLPQQSLSGISINTDTSSTNIDDQVRAVGGPEYVGRSTFVGGNYRTSELPTLSSAKETPVKDIPVFLGGSRIPSNRERGGQKYYRAQRKSALNNNSGTSTTNNNQTSSSSTAIPSTNHPFHPTSSRPRIVSKSEKYAEQMEMHLKPLINTYGENVGEEEIRVHTASDSRYLPRPTRKRQLTTTESAAESLSNLLDPNRSETLRKKRWLYKRDGNETRKRQENDQEKNAMGNQIGDTTANATANETGLLLTGTLQDRIFGGTEVTENNALREEHGITLDAVAFEYERDLIQFGDSGGRSNVSETLTLESLRTITSNLATTILPRTLNQIPTERSIQIRKKFFQHIELQINRLIQYSETNQLETPLLSIDSIQRILHRIGMSSLNMNSIQNIMIDVKRSHRLGDARARVLYQLRETFPKTSLSNAAVAESGMDSVIASTLRKYMDIDHIGESGQQCVIKSNQTRKRRRETWGKNCEVRLDLMVSS